MSNVTMAPNGADTAEMLRAAVSMFQMSYKDLKDLIEDVKRGDFEQVRDLRAEIGHLKKAALQLHDEAQNVQKLCDDTGATGAGSFNFDDARSEIGSRLARLRAAGGTGELSERPE